MYRAVRCIVPYGVSCRAVYRAVRWIVLLFTTSIYGDERVRDGSLGVEVLDDEDDVDRQPAGAEHRHDDDHQARHAPSSPRRLGRAAASHRPLTAAGTPASDPAAAATSASSSSE